MSVVLQFQPTPTSSVSLFETTDFVRLCKNAKIPPALAAWVSSSPYNGAEKNIDTTDFSRVELQFQPPFCNGLGEN